LKKLVFFLTNMTLFTVLLTLGNSEWSYDPWNANNHFTKEQQAELLHNNKDKYGNDLKVCAGMFDGWHMSLSNQGEKGYYGIMFNCAWYDQDIETMSIERRTKFLDNREYHEKDLWKKNPSGVDPKTCSESTNFAGLGSANSPVKREEWNNRVSSFFVMPGCKLKLFKEEDDTARGNNDINRDPIEMDTAIGIMNGMHSSYLGCTEGREGFCTSEFRSGVVWNLVAHLDNTVSKFTCECNMNDWIHAWRGPGLTKQRRRTGSVSEPLAELQEATSGAPAFNPADPSTWEETCLDEHLTPVECPAEDSADDATSSD